MRWFRSARHQRIAKHNERMAEIDAYYEELWQRDLRDWDEFTAGVLADMDRHAAEVMERVRQLQEEGGNP